MELKALFGFLAIAVQKIALNALLAAISFMSNVNVILFSNLG